MKGRALGKGLSALIPGAEETSEGLLEIPLEEITANPYQPRERSDPDSLRELADSIRENGVIQPIAVCRRDNGYQLISGARRLKACRLAGLRTIPAVLLEIKSDAQLLELAIIENIQREDLNPMELAQGYQRLINECSLTQEEIAKKVGKQRSTVANTLRLLKLPEIIRKGIKDNQISTGHAKALMAVEDPEQQIALFRRAVKEGLNVRKLESLAKKISRGSVRRISDSPVKNPYLKEFEDRLRQRLATKVSINPKAKGGSIEIAYFSDSELERIVELLESINDS